MKPILSVQGLGKSYVIRHGGTANYKSLRDEIFNIPKRFFVGDAERREQFWAIKDVSFDVMPGERLGIIGHNGAGKSTLLKLLSRITDPTTGRIVLRGRVASLLEVGTGFHPELTGRENIFLNGAILGMSRGEVRQKFDEIVDFAGVEKFLDTPVKRFSSGMYVRLAFAVAAHLEPDILIVDEVLAVGDAAFQKKCLGKMNEISESGGRTILFVSHNMGAMQQLCNKGVVLAEGRIGFWGKQSDAVDFYLNCEKKQERRSLDAIRPNKQLSRSVEFLDVYFERGRFIFPFDSPIPFKADVKSNDFMGSYRVSLTIFSISGVPVASSFSEECYTIKNCQQKTIEVVIPPIRLAPGKYYLSISVGKGTHKTGHIDFDILSGVLDFEIESPSSEDGSIAHWTSGWGNIIAKPLQKGETEQKGEN